MNNQQSLLISLCLFIFLQMASVACFFFIRQKSKKKQHLFFFGLFFTAIAGIILASTIALAGKFYHNQTLTKTANLNGFLYFISYPLLYLGLKSFITQEKNIVLKKYAKHLILSSAIFIIDILLYIGYDITFHHQKLYKTDILYALLLAHHITYCIVAYHIISNKAPKSKNSNKIKIVIGLLLSYLIFRSISLIAFLLFQINLLKIGWATYFIFVLTAIFTFLLLFIKLTDTKSKYQNSALSKEKEEEIYNKILEHLTKEKPFLDNTFSLLKLSENLQTSSKHISQAINSKYNSNFNDFVNHFRIQESIELLKSTTKKELLISEIYYTVGFNSKSTFNTLFKKTHGKTPSQYRKEHLK